MEKENEKRCDVCKNKYFERNNYFCGKLMTVRDFFAEQCYFNEKRWLINRMVHGWGVVCGLKVYEQDGKVFVTPGLAIDCCGREILVCGKDQEVPLVPEESECHKEQAIQGEEGEKKLLICLEFYECKTEALHLPPIACDQKEKCEFNRIRDSFKIRVIPDSEVDIEAPYGKYCPLLEDKRKPLHGYLCEKLKEGCPECPERPCLVLAEISIIPSSSDPGGPPVIEIDQCSKRKLVYGNPVLYDLIDCFHGDLPHIEKISWKGNGIGIPWEDFDEFIYKKGLKVGFDRKIDKSTINRNTFLFLVNIEDADTGNYKYEQVPGEVSYKYDKNTGDSTATFKCTSKWLYDVYFGYSRVREKGGEFMVILKSDFILSAEENGKPAKALDGNFIGGKLPSGNGTQGGDFVSWFYVEPPKTEEKKSRRSRRKRT